MSKRITFLMPRDGREPIGGFKVVYEYANRLVKDGYDVEIVYPAYIRRLKTNLCVEFLRKFKCFVAQNTRSDVSCKSWFKLDSRIQESYLWSLSDYRPSDKSIIIATAATTAPYLHAMNADDLKKFYLIQGFECWAGADEKAVYNTYKYGLKNISVSKWLTKKIESVGAEADFVPNGFDTTQFKVNIIPEKRDPKTILLMYHYLKSKGVDDAMQAIEMCRKKHKDIKILMFGAVQPPRDISERVEFHYQPNRDLLTTLYNRAAIFVGASHNEGWGLTIGEAMLCGCAVACTDNDGYLEMAKHGQNALVSPIQDPISLANNIERLINNDILRTGIAENASKDMLKFDLELSYVGFKTAIGL